ncbi:hypothetical protein I4U23_026732 [Adineta vaga]|nr:hypothetical protein I4U23_026732 [Adineta vaga]
MAHVASTNGTETSPRPRMDRLTHAILKETSKSLKYYMDVKSRENAFVLDGNTSVFDLIPSKTKLMLGTNNKQHPSFYDLYYTDKHMKNSSVSFQYKPKQLNATLISPEREMCREELNFHMRSYSFLGKETPKIPDVQVRSTNRSNSLNVTKRHIRSRSAFKLSRHQQDHLINNTADILASMVKSRRSINQSSIQPSITNSNTKTTSFTHKSKPITKGVLCEYKLSITTGNCNGASTNAPIRIKLYGTDGHTSFHELIHSQTHHVPFLKNQTDTFILHTYHVGVLIGITIGHDRKDMKASWYLSKVCIDDPICKEMYEISCNGWLSIKSNDQKTMRDFPVISTVSYDKKTNLEDYEEIESQSGFSTLSTTGTATSNKSNSNNDHKHNKQQRRVSIGPTSIATKPTTKQIASQPRSPILSTSSSDDDDDDDDTEINNDITTQICSINSTPSPTLNETRLQSVCEHDILELKPTNDIFQHYSIDYDRPPTRLEQRTSPLSLSLEQSKQNEE